MRRFLTFSCVFVLLAVVTLSVAVPVRAQSSGGWTAYEWVTSPSIQDLTGNSAVPTNQPLLAGHAYNLTVDIVVPSTLTSTPSFQVSLNPEVVAAPGQAVYWVVHNPSYPGYNRSAFVGGSKTVSLSYDQGTVKMSAYFQIPVNFTNPVAKYTSPSGNGTFSLHLPQPVTFVSTVPVGGSSTGYFSASVEDQDIQTYLNDYNQTAALVPSGKISSTFSTLVNSILAQAQSLDQLGLPSNATALLNTIVPSEFPVPPSSSLQTGLLVGLAGAVVVIILLAVLMLRSRGKSGYSVSIINDVQKDLAVLEVTAAKYDRAMADKLKSIRDKLSESS